MPVSRVWYSSPQKRDLILIVAAFSSSGRMETAGCGAPLAGKPWKTISFRGDDRDKVEVFRENRAAIEQGVRQKYAAGDTETDGSVLIHSGELKPRAARK